MDEAAINNLRSDYKQHFAAHPQKGVQRLPGRSAPKSRNNARGRQNGFQPNGHQGHPNHAKNGRSYNSSK